MSITIGKEGAVQAIFTYQGEIQDEMNLQLVEYVKDHQLFTGKKGEIFTDLGPNGANQVFVGLGEKETSDAQAFRLAAFQLAKKMEQLKVSEVAIHLPTLVNLCTCRSVGYITEGLIQATYTFEAYKSEQKPLFETNYFFVTDHKPEKVQKRIEEVTKLMEGVFLTRDLVNTPPVDMDPETLADAAKQTLEPLGVQVEVLTRPEIEELGMEAFLSVARGSKKEPRFIVMKYLPNPDQKAIALVGKGITYDSGGYALKPAKGMEHMKNDMAGSASVIGAMYAVASNQLDKNVVGVIAACENLISGDAYKNGDIIGSMKGTSIEVINTDAEGRITLADSLYYAATEIDSEVIIDLATLTGACVVGLSDYITGLVTNNDALCTSLRVAGDVSGEYLWPLPVVDELREQVKGKLGDLVNSTGKPGGAMTAGIFLEEFVEGKPWVHMDIAGPAFASGAYSYLPDGASGIPVKTLYHFIKQA